MTLVEQGGNVTDVVIPFPTLHRKAEEPSCTSTRGEEGAGPFPEQGVPSQSRASLPRAAAPTASQGSSHPPAGHVYASE